MEEVQLQWQQHLQKEICSIHYLSSGKKQFYKKQDYFGIIQAV